MEKEIRARAEVVLVPQKEKEKARTRIRMVIEPRRPKMEEQEGIKAQKTGESPGHLVLSRHAVVPNPQLRRRPLQET